MKYKVTALEDVTILAYVRFTTPQRIGDTFFIRPSERQEWIELEAGETREDLGLVIGVHPSCLPDHAAVSVGGVTMVLAGSWSNGQLPKEFFGLYRLEIQGESIGGAGSII